MSTCSRPIRLAHIFLAQKPDGKKRFILNLKKLNTFIDPPHVKIKDYRTLSKLMTPSCYGATVDIRNAYHFVNVAVNVFLRFQFEGQLY